MTILLDMDGVIAQCHQKVLEVYRDQHGADSVPFDEPTEYWMETNFPDPVEAKKRIYDIFKMPGLFASFAVQPGSQEAVTQMIEDGHDIYFCSTPMFSNPTCCDDKISWINKHFFGMGDKLILTAHKRMVAGDLLVDDKPHISGHHEPTWKHVTIDQEYNKMLEVPRIHRDWSNWREIFTEVLG